jgi:transposase
MGVSKYSEEFRESAVQLVVEKGKSIQQVARELGVCVKTMRGWVERQQRAQRGDALRIQELEREVKLLKKELAEAQENVDILKKTTAILSKR